MAAAGGGGGSATVVSFSATLKGFCDELRLTFPELAPVIDRASVTTVERFWASWKGDLAILLERSADQLFSERRGLMIGAVQMTPALWGELSESTQNAIWKYLRTLVLEAAMVTNIADLDADTTQTLIHILTAERLESGGAEADAAAAELFEEAMPHLEPLMGKLRGMMGGFMDLSGAANIPLPEIPAHLRNGRIAKLAEEMSKQFSPADFGIDPALLAGEDVEQVLKRLAELYQRDPTILIAGAKRVAEKIKKQILGGSLDREALMQEAQEFVTLFKEHPLFKEAIAKFQSLVGEGGLASMFGGGEASSGAPSERRRAVQERLRAKLDARKKAAKK